MVAINLVHSELSNDTVDLVFTDSMKGSSAICERVKKAGIFNHVYYIQMSDFLVDSNISSLKRKIKLFSNYCSFYLKPEHLISGKYGVYDSYGRLFVFQVNIDLELCFYQYCYRKNPDLQLNIYEEAYLSYFSDNGALKINTRDVIDVIGTVLFRRNMRKNISNAYYFHPEFVQYHSYFVLKKMIPFSQNVDYLKPVLNSIFNFNPNLIKHSKVIYVEDSYYEQGIDIGDNEFVCKLHSKLGNRMIVKLHPRSLQDRFSPNYIRIMKRNDIPLELYALNCNDDLVLISMYSSGIISTALCNEHIKSYFVYPLAKKHIEDMEKRLNKILKYFSDKCRVVENIDQMEIE